MGCDGGTIPKRNEIVKSKQKAASQDKSADLAARWQFCSISGLPLKRPIVACQLGRLYNKEAILEHLLKKKNSNDAPLAPHIRSLRDVRELTLKEKSDYDQVGQTSNGQCRTQFACPISGLELNGKYKFFYILNCGCVLSERSLKEVPNNNKCLLCHQSYYNDELIVLNGDSDEIRILKDRMLARKKERSSKKRTYDGKLKDN